MKMTHRLYRLPARLYSDSRIGLKNGTEAELLGFGVDLC